jgi:hypothetical protein
MTVPLFTQVDLAGRIDLVGNPPLALPRYDNVCRAVRELKTVDEVDEIVARAEAVRAYAKQARNKQLELDAAEIRIRAERRVGELMQGAARAIGLNRGGGDRRSDHRVGPKPGDPATLAEAGIDKNLAHRARTLVALPEEKFEELLHEKRRREDRRVNLAPEFPADAASNEIEIPRDVHIAPVGAESPAAERRALIRQVTTLRRRVAALAEENSALEDRVKDLEEGVKTWKERAHQAGWNEATHASSSVG